MGMPLQLLAQHQLKGLSDEKNIRIVGSQRYTVKKQNMMSPPKRGLFVNCLEALSKKRLADKHIGGESFNSVMLGTAEPSGKEQELKNSSLVGDWLDENRLVLDSKSHSCIPRNPVYMGMKSAVGAQYLR